MNKLDALEDYIQEEIKKVSEEALEIDTEDQRTKPGRKIRFILGQQAALIGILGKIGKLKKVPK